MTNAEIWMLERTVFQQIMMEAGLHKLEDQIKFLRSVPLCSNLPDEILVRLSDAFEVVCHKLISLLLVTRLRKYFSNILPFIIMKICPMAKNSQSRFKHRPITK